MFNLRYNFLAVGNVILGLINSLLLIRVFGVSASADAYLIAANILAALQFIQLMFVEQFMFFYNDLRVVDKHNARTFYQSAVTFALLTGVVLYLLFVLAADPILRVFAFSLDLERFALLKQIYLIMVIGTVVDAASAVNQRLLNAEMRFSIPYLLSAIQTVFSVALLGYLTYTHRANVELIAWGRAGGGWVACLAGFFVLGRLGFRPRLSLRHPALKPFIKNSISMRFGHNIHNVLISPITNNVLALLPGGLASIYYYAQRLHQVIGNVVVSPSYAVMHARVSSHWSAQNRAAISIDIRKFLLMGIALFVGATLIAYFCVPLLLPLVSSTIHPKDMVLIQQVFLALAPWYLLAVVESPFLSVSIASKNSLAFICTNSLFITVYFFLAGYLAKSMGIYAIPFSMAMAQTINVCTFVGFSLVLLRQPPSHHDTVG